VIPEPIVLLSALEHHLYCPRQCALIHIDGVWAENAHTVAGQRAHRRVDSGASRSERGHRVLRAIPLFSDRYGLVGRSDAVEVHDDGLILPVEYKAGGRHGQAADVQLCAQGLCLEEMTATPVMFGHVRYAEPRRRLRVEFGTELPALTIAVIEEIRESMRSGVLPSALADERCVECQLEPHCLPHVVIRSGDVRAYVDREVLACA
jgi:CRISPR-associated exonuclease Cas4